MRIIALLVCFLISACTSKKTQEATHVDSLKKGPELSKQPPGDSSIGTVNSGEFQDQVFGLIRAQDYVEGGCEISHECDCCYSQLSFLALNKFFLLVKCSSGDDFFSGTYTSDSANLNLIFSKRYLSETSDDDYEGEIEIKELNQEPLAFQIELCNGKLHLINGSNERYAHGFRYKAEIENVLMQQLMHTIRNSDALKELNL